MMRTSVVAALCALMLFACSKEVQVDPDVAEQVVPQFHMALNDARFDDIYNSAADSLRQESTRQDFAARLQKVHTTMGPISGTKRQSHKAVEKSGEVLVTLVYASTYAAGEAKETFTVRMRDNAPQLAAYEIDAPALSKH